MVPTLLRYRVLFILALVGSLSVEAGVSRFGILGGVNLANISSQPDDAFKSRMGIIAGGYYELLVSSVVGLSSEFLLASKGGQRGTDLVTLKISYFEVPLLLKIHFGAKRVGAYLFCGPHVGFVTASSGETVDGESLGLSNLYPNEMGAQIGAGVEFPVSSSLGITLNGRYSIGLSDISQAANNYKTKGIYILAGLSFRMEEEDQYTDTEFRAQEYLRNRNAPTPNSDGFVETPP